MVFPSLFVQVEPGVTTQFTGFIILAFSFLIQRSRRWIALALLIASGILFCQSRAHAIAAMPGYTYQNWGPYSPFIHNNYQFYGPNWGQVPPVYFYPMMNPFMGMPYPSYFMPHNPSPYGPNYCPTCNQPQYPIIPFNPFNPNVNPHGPLS